LDSACDRATLFKHAQDGLSNFPKRLCRLQLIAKSTMGWDENELSVWIVIDGAPPPKHQPTGIRFMPHAPGFNDALTWEIKRQ
jgi:hypothetical protein